jgi:hypothetical protein
MDSFARFIPDGIHLDPVAIRGAGLAARPFPEYPDYDGIVAVARLVEAQRAEFWHHEYQKEPHHLAALSVNQAARDAFDFGCYDVLIAFETARTYLWLPGEHEFFVIFAPPSTLEKIQSAGIFAYDFDEYAHEDYFAGKRSEFLVENGRRYTIDSSGGDPDFLITRPSTMLADFPLFIEYAQVLIHAESHMASGLLWTDDHVAQGFAWSQGEVSFGVPDHDGECRMTVDLAHGGLPDPRSLWAVQVPFVVTGPVQIGTPFDMHGVEVPNGSYNLTYQAFPGTDHYAYVLRLTFSQSDTPAFHILKKGGDITADMVLRHDAEPVKPA